MVRRGKAHALLPTLEILHHSLVKRLIIVLGVENITINHVVECHLCQLAIVAATSIASKPVVFALLLGPGQGERGLSLDKLALLSILSLAVNRPAQSRCTSDSILVMRTDRSDLKNWLLAELDPVPFFLKQVFLFLLLLLDHLLQLHCLALIYESEDHGSQNTSYGENQRLY